MRQQVAQARKLLALVGVVLAVAIVGVAGAVVPPAHAGATSCGDLSSSCGVTGQGNHFHGVLAVTGQPWVLGLSTRSGSAGCGDCTWSMVPACLIEHAGQPDTLCDGATAAPACAPGEVLYRLYLSTAALVDRDEGVICIGGDHQPVAVGDIALADVARYLDDLTPPDLVVATRPRDATLAGLLTYFKARPPALPPSRFGGPTVTETITIRPVQLRWWWGDGDASPWLPAAATASHTYLAGGLTDGSLETRWHATYTVSYAGLTLGPYDADREITERQRFRLPVHTSNPTLVSR